MPEVDTKFLEDTVKLAEAVSDFAKDADVRKEAAASAVDHLISKSIINPSRRADFVEKMVSDPSCVYRTLKKVSNLVHAANMGAGDGSKVETSETADSKFAERFSY